MNRGDFVVFKKDVIDANDIYDVIRAYEVYSMTVDNGVYISNLTYVDADELLVIPTQYIITFSNVDTWEYFYSNNYLQSVSDKFTPAQVIIPHRVSPRENLSDGIVKDIFDYETVYHIDETKVKNPNYNNEPTRLSVIELLRQTYNL